MLELAQVEVPGWAIGTTIAGMVAALGGIYVAVKKLKPEASEIIVRGAVELVTASGTVIDELKEQVEALRQQGKEIEALRGEVHACQRELADTKKELKTVKSERESLLLENTRLRGRVDALEAQVKRINGA